MNCTLAVAMWMYLFFIVSIYPFMLNFIIFLPKMDLFLQAKYSLQREIKALYRKIKLLEHVVHFTSASVKYIHIVHKYIST